MWHKTLYCEYKFINSSWCEAFGRAYQITQFTVHLIYYVCSLIFISLFKKVVELSNHKWSFLSIIKIMNLQLFHSSTRETASYLKLYLYHYSQSLTKINTILRLSLACWNSRQLYLLAAQCKEKQHTIQCTTRFSLTKRRERSTMQTLMSIYTEL